MADVMDRSRTGDATTGAPKSFISGYSSGTMPNIWDRSKETAAA